MIAVIPLLALGGLVFVEQDLPVEREWQGWRNQGVNFRRADLDGDGRQDLIFSTQACFQRNGEFPADARTPLPGMKEHARIDCFGNTLYVRYTDRLDLARWEGGAWQITSAQPIAWPSPAPGDAPFKKRQDPEPDAVELERSLVDVDGDGTPEIVLPGDDGLHVYRRSDQGYAEVARWDVFPRLRVFVGGALWPPQERTIGSPVKYTYLDYVIEGNRVMVLTQGDWSQRKVRYRMRRYVIDPANGFSVVPDAEPEEVSDLIPGWADARRLNNSGHVGFVYTDLVHSEASVLPVPLLETSASTDGGKTFHKVRTQSFEPNNPFIDFNGDGRVDMVTWSTNLFDGGIRETANWFVSGREIEDAVSVYFQDAQGAFSKTPDVTGRFKIRLHRPPIVGGFFYWRYVHGRCYDIGGDFNGDGLHDVAVVDRPGWIEVYLSTGNSFAEQPAGAVPIPEEGLFFVFDVDGDGRTDIVVSWWEGEGQSRVTHQRAYLTREGGQ